MCGRKYFSSKTHYVFIIQCLLCFYFLSFLFIIHLCTRSILALWYMIDIIFEAVPLIKITLIAEKSFFCRHLIGFFLFLFLTIYTATKAPDIMDLSSFQRLPDMIRKAEFYKIHPELLNCLPSLPNLSDIYRLKDELKPSLPSMDFISSVSGNIRELLAKCLPERFSHAYQTENSVLVLSCILDNEMQLCLYAVISCKTVIRCFSKFLHHVLSSFYSWIFYQSTLYTLLSIKFLNKSRSIYLWEHTI